MPVFEITHQCAFNAHQCVSNAYQCAPNVCQCTPNAHHAAPNAIPHTFEQSCNADCYSGVDCYARTGVLHLPHADVKTPVFMPVGTKATVKGVTSDTLEKIGFEIILANTYHLMMRPGEDVVHSMGGLHGFTSWQRNFLTDSGGFQVFSLEGLRHLTEEGVEFASCVDGSRHFLSPEKAVDVQLKLKSDIQMQLDVCTGRSASKEEAKKAAALTQMWAIRAKNEWERMREDYLRESKGGSIVHGASPSRYPLLFPIVQGHFDEQLRVECAFAVTSLGLPGIAIGGLSVGESRGEFVHFLDITQKALRKSIAHPTPIYVMGIGTPRYILEAIRLGVDMADCVLPTRNARNGQYLTHTGPLSIKQSRFERDSSPVDSECHCPVCQKYSRAYLRHLFKEGEMLGSMLASYHNLYFMQQMILDAREAIAQDRYIQWMTNFLSRYESCTV